MIRRRRRRGGFTLLELLVALAVFGLAAGALLSLSAENTRLATHLEARALAGMVADNQAVEAVISPDSPADDAGIASLGGREWRWRRTSQAVAGGLLRIDISVSDAAGEDTAAAVLTVFRVAT